MPQQQTSSPGQGQRFDWWAAPAAAAPADTPPSPPHRRTAVPAQPAPARTDPAPTDQPALATAPHLVAPAAAASPEADVQAGPGARAAAPAPQAVDSTEVYRAVQASAAFQDIRRSYRSFVFPVAGVFLGWYLTYVAAQAAAPGLMRAPVAGPLNVAWLLGLLQFASTFLLTWLYARNARTKRDRAALGLRWDTQDQLR
ncbi:DUF485 domain-containing protein [Streptomyces sp. NRRL S-350]|uniref:DUF485 domain-containing protein n=1 Tax=Streptomyces sp. NRRL S-350 TaxID=1463902 RepID=UPI000AD0A80A|nr:DUF485 domain-containing protein [Streptomyces sp. NRRL S-350]